MPRTRWTHRWQFLRFAWGLAWDCCAATLRVITGRPSWLDLVEDDIRSLVAGTFLETGPIVRTAVLGDGSAHGLEELRVAIRSVCEQVTHTSETELFRLPIDRAFSVQGLGTIVTGTVWSGRLAQGDEIEWLPIKKKVTVRGLQNHGVQTDVVVRGQLRGGQSKRCAS